MVVSYLPKRARKKANNFTARCMVPSVIFGYAFAIWDVQKTPWSFTTECVCTICQGKSWFQVDLASWMRDNLLKTNPEKFWCFSMLSSPFISPSSSSGEPALVTNIWVHFWSASKHGDRSRPNGPIPQLRVQINDGIQIATASFSMPGKCADVVCFRLWELFVSRMSVNSTANRTACPSVVHRSVHCPSREHCPSFKVKFAGTTSGGWQKHFGRRRRQLFHNIWKTLRNIMDVVAKLCYFQEHFTPWRIAKWSIFHPHTAYHFTN